MITSKQRSYLKSISNRIKAIFQLGKGGIDDNFLKQIDEALENREVLKISILESSGFETREASEIICEKLKCEGVLAIGSKLVLYRKSEKNPKIVLPD
jgi:RNA-binding protein